MKIKYKRIIVEVDGKRPNKCALCGKEAKKIDFHHYRYAYSTKEIRKNPQLALDYTIPLCYHCHKKVGDPLRNLMENKEKALRLLRILYPDVLWKIDQ